MVSRIRAAAGFESGFGILKGSQGTAIGFVFIFAWFEWVSSIRTSPTFFISRFSHWKVIFRGDSLELASIE